MKGKKKKNITTWGFIMSVLGAAVGLGSIWGFPNQEMFSNLCNLQK